MAIFSVDDYPDWIDELMNELYKLFPDENDLHFDEEVWALIENFERIPNIGNAQVMVLFSDMKRMMIKRYSHELDEALITEEYFESKFNLEVNNMASHFYFDDESFTELSELDNIIKNWIEENRE